MKLIESSILCFCIIFISVFNIGCSRGYTVIVSNESSTPVEVFFNHIKLYDTPVLSSERSKSRTKYIPHQVFVEIYSKNGTVLCKQMVGKTDLINGITFSKVSMKIE